jgi:hypothetical protein
MRAHCSGPVDKIQLEKEYGWKEGRDYKLSAPNSFYTKNEKRVNGRIQHRGRI